MAGFNDEDELDTSAEGDGSDTPEESDAATSEETAPEADTEEAPVLVQQAPGEGAPTNQVPVRPAPAIANLTDTMTKNSTQRGTVDPLAANALIQSTNEAKAANTQLSQAQQNLNTAQQNAVISTEQARQQQIAHLQAVDQTHRDILDQKNQALMEAQKNYEQASIDPQRYWEKQPLGGKIMSLAAIALSGIGNAFSAAASPGSNAQRNGAWDIIKGQIDADIDAQKVNLEKQGSALGRRSQELQNLRQQFGDERAADAAYAAQQYDAFGKLLTAEANKSNNPVIQANAAKTNAAIQQSKDEKLLELTKGINDSAVAETQKQVVAKTAGQAINKDALAKKPQIQQAAVDAQETIDQIQNNIKRDGSLGSAWNTTLAKYGIRSGEGYNKLNTEKQILFLNEARALLNNRISVGGLEQMAKANPNMFNDPKVLVESLKGFRDNNIAAADNINAANAGLMNTGNDIPAYRELKRKQAIEQQDALNRARKK